MAPRCICVAVAQTAVQNFLTNTGVRCFVNVDNELRFYCHKNDDGNLIFNKNFETTSLPELRWLLTAAMMTIEHRNLTDKMIYMWERLDDMFDE